MLARVALLFFIGGAFLLEGCATTPTTATSTTKKKAAKKKRLPVTPIDEPMFAAGFDESDLDTDEEADLTAVVIAEGVASYYHDMLAGRRTANGETYNPDAQTCAHRTLKFGTIVVIEDLDTGRTARCRINDRGPYVAGRILDMSKRVARDLGVLQRGLARVRIRIVKPDAS